MTRFSRHSRIPLHDSGQVDSWKSAESSEEISVAGFDVIGTFSVNIGKILVNQF